MFCLIEITYPKKYDKHSCTNVNIKDSLRKRVCHNTWKVGLLSAKPEARQTATRQSTLLWMEGGICMSLCSMDYGGTNFMALWHSDTVWLPAI